jgi:hypothetical protein
VAIFGAQAHGVIEKRFEFDFGVAQDVKLASSGLVFEQKNSANTGLCSAAKFA